MSIDKLQDKIRKLKSPLVVDLTIAPSQIPPHIIEAAADPVAAYKLYAKAMLQELKTVVPAVRFSFGSFALYGGSGLNVLREILKFAKAQGFYVILEGVEAFCAQKAEQAAQILLSENCPWDFDGLILDAYIGSDGLRPYIFGLKESEKDLFVVVRTSNRTAQELQDLLTGSRLVHMAKADIVNRFASDLVCRGGYSQVAILAGASSADSLRTLREKYKNIFLLLDGSDYPNANAKNCSYAFDRLGRGAAACIGDSVTAAWREAGAQESAYLELAVQSALRMKKNIARYVTIL